MKKLIKQLQKALDAARTTRKHADDFIGGGYLRAGADVTIQEITEALAIANDIKEQPEPEPKKE